MTTPTEGRSRGLLFVLAATAIAGVSGYAIQLLAAALLPEAQAYLSFSAFWSTLYLFGSAVGGIQQEVARAVSPGVPAAGRSVLQRFGAVATVVVGVLATVVGFVVAPIAFGAGYGSMLVALVVALIGYVLTAIATGLFYGLSKLGAVAALIVVDAVLRGAAVVVGLLLGVPLDVLAFLIALPFGLAVLVVWSVVRKRVVGRYRVDVVAPALARNALHTVVAAAATGLMVTGLPLLFRVALTDASPYVVAALTLAVTLTRAPFIIPLMALQSFLVVTFRDAPEAIGRRVVRYLLAAAAVAVLATAGAWFLGPWAVEIVSQGRYAVDAFTSAIVVLSAVLVGCSCITGPALLAQGRHRLYSAGWVCAALMTVGCLFLVPASPLGRALIALTVAPVIGFLVHAVALIRSPSSGDAR